MLWIALIFFLLLPASAEAEQRILGGQTSALHPSRVSLVDASDNSYESHFCGGTLVRPRWVLTAAHCVDSNPVDAVLGRRNLKTRAGERIAVVAKRVHPLYSLSSLRYDVALLRLSHAPKRFRSVPIGEATSGSTGSVAGWGYTLHTRPAFIRSAEMSIASDQKCKWTYGSFFDPGSMFCTSVSEQSICQGDSGSGFLVGGRVVGVVSYSPPGCSGHPDGYARIDNTWASKIFTERGPWRKRKTYDPAYIHLPPLASYFFAMESSGGETTARLSFYSNYSLIKASVRIEGREFCIPPACTSSTLPLQAAVGRREWTGEVRFRGCLRLHFSGLVSEGRHKGRWMGTRETVCS